jgi:hypothetical protein
MLGRRLILAFAFFALWAGACLAADPELISAAESSAPPTPARLAMLADLGAKEHWGEVAQAARAASFRAYRQNQLPAAEAWQYVQKWAELFNETEGQFIPVWIKAVESAGVANANLPRSFLLKEDRMGAALNPALRLWLLGNVGFSAEFFSLLAPVDFVPQVFKLLNEIQLDDPGRFREYSSLALAIALVYDLPPPPEWPHAQVSATALPRRWPSGVAAFDWWTREDAAGRTYHRLAHLGADELKFVVDAAAPFDQLTWSQKAVPYALADFADTYSMVRYRMERIQGRTMIWPDSAYPLWDILSEGGICVDQAYFATEAGKARGVPTLLFTGAGNDGRHAWFGFLDENRTWQLDAGRYAEQRFLTGSAYDPQTWQVLSDHDIQFLAERFRALPSYRQSRVHAAFAEELLRAGQTNEAVASARKAVNYERRNLAAWETLLTTQQAQGAKSAALEGTLREATIAFQRYPDLEIGFARRLIASLRQRGETSQADFEEHQLARKFQADRGDLSIQQSAEMLQRSFNGEPVTGQIRTYNTVLDNFGREAGIDFFDKIVVVFAEHLLQVNEPAEAIKAVERARQILKVEPGKQLDQEFDALLARLARGGK